MHTYCCIDSGSGSSTEFSFNGYCCCLRHLRRNTTIAVTDSVMVAANNIIIIIPITAGCIDAISEEGKNSLD